MKRTILAILFSVSSTAALAHGAQHGQGVSMDSDEAPAFGREGDPKKATRTVKIGMSDAFRFTPAEFTVKQGETVRFVVHNGGKLQHELVLGRAQDLKAHAEVMRKNPGMEHDDPYMAHVAPGRTGTMMWQFTEPGEFEYGCLVPGHFEAGMRGRIHVVASAGDHGMTQEKVPMSEGVVRKVNKDTQKLTIRHGPIPSLDMPSPMTMVYRVSDPAFLDRVKPGDKVQFRAEKVNGAFVVTAIESEK